MFSDCDPDGTPDIPSVRGRFHPRLTLRTLNRGDGLLGLKPFGKLGPRGDSVTVARLDWTYRTDAGGQWHTPAPSSILNNRPQPTQELIDADGRVVQMQRDL